MFAELGRMKIRRLASTRIELGLDRFANAVGGVIAVAAVAAAFPLAAISTWLCWLALAVAAAGALIASARHHLIFDRGDGVVRIDRAVAGLTSSAVIPLFHLRAVVVQRRGDGYVAVLERRNGAPIVIDTADRAGRLYELVRAIADVTELRLVYDATQAS